MKLVLVFRVPSLKDPLLWKLLVCLFPRKRTYFLYPFLIFRLLLQKAEELNIYFYTYLCNWKCQLSVILDNERKTREVPGKAMPPPQAQEFSLFTHSSDEQNICTLFFSAPSANRSSCSSPTLVMSRTSAKLTALCFPYMDKYA